MSDEPVNGMVSTSSDAKSGLSNPPESPPSPSIERARLQAQIDARIYFRGELWRYYSGGTLYEENEADINELQAALDKLDKEQK